MDNPYLEATPNPYLNTAPEPHTTPPPTVHPPRKVEQPKGARPNMLRTLGEALDFPLAVLQATAGDFGHALQKRDFSGLGLAPVYLSLGAAPPGAPHIAQLQSDLRSGGIHKVAENDIYPRMGSLQRVLNDPTASRAAKHAAHIMQNTPALASLFDFTQEWFNPSNYGVGEAARLVRPLVKAARYASPEVDTIAQGSEYALAGLKRAASKAASKAATTVAKHIPGSFGFTLRSLVDRYEAAGLPQRGGMPFVYAALATQAAPEHAVAVATNRIRSIFDGLTTAQKRELQKLSYVDENGERFATRDANVPEPKKGPSLEDRAGQVRGILFDLDRRQSALGIRQESRVVMPRGKNPNAKPKVVSGELYDSGRFFPMRQFGEQPVFQSQELAKAAQSQNPNELTNMIARRAGRGRGKFSAGVTNARHKVQRDLPDILNPEVEADLHPEYDPAYQLERHVGDTERAIANEQARRNLEALPSIDPETGILRTTNIPGKGESPLYARMPLQYFLEPNASRPLAMIFGEGETGRKGMETYIKRVAQAKAQELARQDPHVLKLADEHGIDVNRLGRSIRNANLAPLKARMAEAEKAGRGAGRLAQNVAGIASRTKAEMASRANDLTNEAQNLENARAAAASIPKAKITKGMDAGAAAAAQAHNAAREADLNPLPLGRTEAAAEEATRAGKTASVGFDRAAAQANGLRKDTADHLENLNQTFQERAAKAETAAAFQKAVQHYYSDAFESVAKNIREDATHAPNGYVKESDLGLASPTGRDMALDESFAEFLKENPSLPMPKNPALQKVVRAFDVLNRMARMSIVLVPTVHGINNMGMAYLAEGGDPATMAAILAGKKEFSEELRQRAYAAGAATDWSQQTFSLGERGAHATTDIGEHAAMIGKRAGPFSKVVTPAAKGVLHAGRAYNALNTWLFRKAEQGYAIDLFDRLTRNGMSDGEAALQIRNALGRYDNISPLEAKMNLNRMFYFYPWMKTVVAYWTKKGLIDPKWWDAPVAAIRTNNEQQGYDDPSHPFTATLGMRGPGEWRRYTIPIPQRVLSHVADVARAPYDLARGDFGNLGTDLKAPFSYVAGHFNPFIQLGKDAAALASQGEQRIAPWNTFKVQPGESGFHAIVNVGTNVLARFLAPIARGEEITGDPAGASAAFITGAFDYGVKTQGEQNREKAIRQGIDAIYHPYIQAATTRKDDAAVQKLQALREESIQRAINNRGTSPQQIAPPAPATTPSASTNPYMQP